MGGGRFGGKRVRREVREKYEMQTLLCIFRRTNSINC